jgi:hypothetical protein
MSNVKIYSSCVAIQLSEQRSGISQVFQFFKIPALLDIAGPALQSGYFNNLMISKKRELEKKTGAFLFIVLIKYLPGISMVANLDFVCS